MERADEFSITIAAVSIVQHELNKGRRSSVSSSQSCERKAEDGYKLAVAIDRFGNGKRPDSELLFFYKTHHDFCSVVDGGITALLYSLVIYWCFHNDSLADIH